MNLAICLKIIVIIWIPLIYGADEDSDFDDHCDIDDGDLPTGNGTTNPGPGPEKPGPEKPGPEKPGPGTEKPGPEKPGPDKPKNNATKCRCGIALNDTNPGVRPWTVFIHIPRTKEVHIGTIIASNVIIVNHMTVFDPSGKGNVQTPKVYPHFAGAKAIDITKLKVTQTSSPDSQSYKVVEIDVLPDFLELNPDVTSSPVDIAAIIVDFNFASGQGPKWPICLPEAEHLDNVKDVSFILSNGVSNHEMVTLRNSTECDKEARANTREVSWNPLNWERMCASLGRNHWAHMNSNPTVPVTYKDENTYYFYGNNLFYYNDAKPFYQYLPNLKFSKKRLEEILGKRVTKLCEGNDDSSVTEKPGTPDTSTPGTVDPNQPECGVNGELPDAKDCGQDPNDSKPGVQPWTVFIHIPRTTEVHVGTIVSPNTIIVKHTTVFDPPGKVDTRTKEVYPFHDGAKVVDIKKIKVTQTASPDSQSYKVVDIDVLPRFMESSQDTSPPVDMAAIIVDFKFSKDTGPKWPICLPKSFHVGNVEKISFVLGDGISNHKMHPIRRSSYCDGLRKLVWSSVPYNPVNWGSMCVQTFFNYWQQYTSNLYTIPVIYKEGKSYFFYGTTMFTDNAILYYQYLPNLKNSIARLDDIFRKKSKVKCPPSMVMGRSLKDDGALGAIVKEEFKSSRCKCGVNPGDNQPGVRPWTVFIHVSGLPQVHVGTIVSSNIILVNHFAIFENLYRFETNKYPSFPGVKVVDMSRLLVTETASPKSLSYKVLHMDVIPRFIEPHPEDTTPAVDMVAIVVDYNFASGEGTKWPICLPKPGHIGRIKQISFILPGGISNDEKLEIHKSTVCDKELIAENREASKCPPHWETMCARPMVDIFAGINVATTLPVTYVVDEDKSVTYFYGNYMYYLVKKAPFYTLLPGNKFVVKKLVNLFENRKTEFCPIF